MLIQELFSFYNLRGNSLLHLKEFWATTHVNLTNLELLH